MNILEALALRGEAESYERQENAWLLEHITKVDSFDLIMKKEQQL
ncbi:MAG TPA: peptide chain release factor N(5)-glutamine methyltransferase, partial [Acinetobacter lwoffii]|nr:peptide chain release factor N(5)-glutamine methyltransferase [Acinetobacter lwoffii]